MSGNHAWRRTSDAGRRTSDIGHRTTDIGHRTSDGEKSKNNISTPQGGGHNQGHTHTTNVPTKYQLATPCGFQDIAQTRFYSSRSLQQGQIKVTPWHCTSTPPTKVPTKYHLPTPYGFWDRAQTNFYLPPADQSVPHGWKQHPASP